MSFRPVPAMAMELSPSASHGQPCMAMAIHAMAWTRSGLNAGCGAYIGITLGIVDMFEDRRVQLKPEEWKELYGKFGPNAWPDSDDFQKNWEAALAAARWGSFSTEDPVPIELYIALQAAIELPLLRYLLF